jgi:hypothetical protein
MIRFDSIWVKLPVTMVLVVMMALVNANTPSLSARAIATIGGILLVLGYVLGIDSTIVRRIVKMKPLNRILNGLYYLVLGGIYLAIMSISGGFVFLQFAFVVFVCLVGISMLTYHLRKGGAIKAKGFKLGFALSTLLVAIGSDVGVTAVFFSVFAIINYVTGIQLFILGYLIRWVGGFAGNKLGVPKEEPFPEEESSSK